MSIPASARLSSRYTADGGLPCPLSSLSSSLHPIFLFWVETCSYLNTLRARQCRARVQTIESRSALGCQMWRAVPSERAPTPLLALLGEDELAPLDDDDDDDGDQRGGESIRQLGETERTQTPSWCFTSQGRRAKRKGASGACCWHSTTSKNSLGSEWPMTLLTLLTTKSWLQRGSIDVRCEETTLERLQL